MAGLHSRPGAGAGLVDDAATARELPSLATARAPWRSPYSPCARRRAGTSDAITSPTCGASDSPRPSDSVKPRRGATVREFLAGVHGA